MKLLLHVCCAPCSTIAIKELSLNYDLFLYFYNPNIEPLKEYSKRKNEIIKYAKIKKISLITDIYDNKEWRKQIKNIEQEKEGGKRCEKCFEYRLKKTAEIAKKRGIKYFTTTLTVSPYKNFLKIKTIGKKIEKETGIIFLEKDFKKKDGYLKSIKLSKENNLYRQNYCGCLLNK